MSILHHRKMTTTGAGSIETGHNEWAIRTRVDNTSAVFLWIELWHFFKPMTTHKRLWDNLVWLSNNYFVKLQWRQNECNGVSNHQRLDCLLKRSFRRISKKTSKLHVTSLCKGNPPVTGGGFPHKGPVTQKMFPFYDVIINTYYKC